MAMRVIVCGGRKYDAEWNVFNALANVFKEMSPEGITVIEGGATGADEAAALWAETWLTVGESVKHEQYAAKWSAACRDTCDPKHRRRRRNGSTYCPAAGNYRNQEMLNTGADLVLAFPGSSGTRDMVTRSLAAGVRVITGVELSNLMELRHFPTIRAYPQKGSRVG